MTSKLLSAGRAFYLDSLTGRVNFVAAIMIAVTALLVVMVESGRETGFSVPIPFLLLYASVVAAGGAAGIVGGGLSGTIAGAYVIHSALIGFGPRTLTGGVTQTALGVVLYLGTGLLIGRIWDQRNQFRTTSRSQEAKLENLVAELSGQLAAIFRHTPVAIFLKDTEGVFRIVNAQFAEWYGISESDAIGKTSHDIFPKEMADLYVAHDREVMAKREAIQHDRQIVFHDGSIRTVNVTKFPVFDDRGELNGIGTVNIDITKQLEAEQQLQQTRKLDALGQLTGGVAHDFNNLLTTIIGNLELLESELGDDRQMRDQIEAALRAGHRGAELTKQLLAFSRTGNLVPTLTDLNDVVPGTIQLLRRTLGEDIRIQTVLGPDLWLAMIDQSLLESALLNLAVNARDAMPEGGEIRFETANIFPGGGLVSDSTVAGLEPGHYVMLAVSDTGKGMSDAILQRVFEPFFTTKDVGKGTGLGLSMVFGFVEHSGGHVDINSKEGRGTTVRLFFPRAETAEKPEQADAGGETAAAPEGKETVLVVEDDHDVRTYVVDALQTLGYVVFQAEDGASALRFLEAAPPINLLLSDVVMPGGMSGFDLLDATGELYPKMKVLLMSGYTDHPLFENSEREQHRDILVKPFTREILGEAVRRALDHRAP